MAERIAIDSKQFSDPALSEAVKKAAPLLSGFGTRLNAISHDIKNLEALLQASAVREPVHVAVHPYTGEVLAWRLAEPDKWRIVLISRTNPETPTYSPPAGGEAIPLIEAPVEMRIRAAPSLPMLVTGVAQAAERNRRLSLPRDDGR